jgi:hypothetical protein
LYLTTPTGELGNTPDGDRSAADNHNRALTWYVGTANLSSGQIPSTVIVTRPAEVYRRLGDLVAAGYKDPKQTWYTPSQTDANFAHGDKNAPWEGIGTGWFNSVLGGGATNQVRPANNTSTIRLKVSEDNLQGPAPMHGDYAVSTLFNGNFDVVSPSWDPTGSTQSIAGWSIDSNAQQQHLKNLVRRITLAWLYNLVELGESTKLLTILSLCLIGAPYDLTYLHQPRVALLKSH